ncbi:BatD family protein [Labrenzia sp. VG12]|uniref:BatD family protein n=1 Tax=Labrenzia sp. VG12 TaxID=2021862 RepID=UPI000B8C1C36|nr:BatD family protein [Labrenzia sp. VG12]ASP33503.1 hypothetical protein CHH27_09795 [Labrenzia sp. VG12]
MTRSAFLTLTALLWLLPQLSLAADLPEPIVEVEFEKTQTIPGQFLPLRITILVPTWMPQPAVFPSLDAPNVRVRLPERATSPTSRRIDGEDWSGVSRRYMITPLVPGRFSLPGGTVDITYADPDNTSVPLTTSLDLGAIEIEGIVPEGAEQLTPFIAAKTLTLTQEISGETTDLKPGDSIRRTVTVALTGASPMMLPQLTEVPQIEGFAAYAETPVLEEKDDRGLLSGSRKEVVTLMVQGNGQGDLPALELSWYDITSGTIETASLDAVPVTATGAPAVARESLTRFDARIALAITTGLIALLALAYLCWPHLALMRRERRARYQKSKAFARRRLLAAIARQDYPATVRALKLWAERPPHLRQEDQVRIREALRLLGANRYGARPRKTGQEDWRILADSVRRSVPDDRQDAGKHRLPLLNP